jgi:DNA-binding NarL/FixJ family response regulator
MSMQKIRIAIADDHQICRDGLISMLDPDNYEIVGEAENGISIIEVVKKSNPDIIFMDIQMPTMDGIEATKIIKNSYPTTQVIALTMHGQESYITEMIDAGASGYLSKNALKAEIIEAIQTVSQDKQYYCKTISRSISQIIKKKNENSRTRMTYDLSETDIKIIKLLCDEYNSESIGKLLFLSKRTIDGARLRIQTKLNVSTTAGIVKFAIENGIYRRSKEQNT